MYRLPKSAPTGRPASALASRILDRQRSTSCTEPQGTPLRLSGQDRRWERALKNAKDYFRDENQV